MELTTWRATPGKSMGGNLTSVSASSALSLSKEAELLSAPSKRLLSVDRAAATVPPNSVRREILSPSIVIMISRYLEFEANKKLEFPGSCAVQNFRHCPWLSCFGRFGGVHDSLTIGATGARFKFWLTFTSRTAIPFTPREYTPSLDLVSRGANAIPVESRTADR